MTDTTSSPSQRGAITQPLGDYSAGFNGSRGSDRFYHAHEGREYMIDRLVNRHGWTRTQSQGAEVWVDKLLERYPAITHDQHQMAVDLVSLVAETVHDPHDWDSHGTVLDLLEWYEKTV